MIEKIKKNKNYFITFFIAFLPRVILCLLSSPFKVRADEYGMIASTAYFAGYDWSTVTSNTAYYGFGLSIWFLPLFHLIKNPVWIYRGMLLIQSVVQSLAAPIAYHISGKYLKIQNRKYCFMMAIVAGFFMVTRSNVLMNETGLILCAWLIAWILMALSDQSCSGKRQIAGTVCLALVLSYSLTLHTRAITFWIAFVCVLVLFYINKRKWLVSLPVFVITGGCGFGLAKLLIKYVQNKVWKPNSIYGLANADLEVLGLKDLLLNPKNWLALFNTIIGQINTFTVISGGLLLVGFVILCYFLLQNISGKVWKSYEKNPALIKENEGYLLLYYSICMAITICGQCFSSWIPNVVKAMEGGFDNANYYLKVFSYIRYAGPYIGPIMLITLAVILDGVKEKKVWKTSILCYILLQAGWYICIMPYGYRNSVINEAYLPLSLGNNVTKNTNIYTFLLASFVAAAVFAFFLLFTKKQKYTAMLLLCGIFISYQYLYEGYFQDVLTAKESYSSVEKTLTVLMDLDEKIDLPQNIYVSDWDNDSHQDYYVYQFFLSDHSIQLQDPDEDEVILVTNSYTHYDSWLKKGYQVIVTDEKEKEGILIKGEELQKKVRDLGYEFTDTRTRQLNGMRIGMNEEIAKKAKSGYIKSNGEEGFLLSEQNFSFEAGKLHVEAYLQVRKYTQEHIGFIDIYTGEDGQVLKKVNIESDMLDEKGWVQLEMDVSCETTNNLELRVYAQEGSEIALRTLHYNRVSYEHEVGESISEEMSGLTHFITKVHAGGTSVVLLKHGEKKENTKLSLLNAQTGISWNKALPDEVEGLNPELILMENHTDRVFPYLSEYTVIQKTAHYTLLQKSDLVDREKVEKNGGRILSEGKKLNLLYCQQEGNKITSRKAATLQLGTYRITSEIDLKEEREEIGYLKVNDGNEKIRTINYEKNEDKWIAVDEIFNYQSAAYVTLDSDIDSECDQYKNEIFIEKLSDSVPVDLEELDLGAAELTDRNTICVTGEEGGEAIQGPKSHLNPGKYILKYTYCLEEFGEEHFATAKVTRYGNSLGYKQLKSDDYKKNQTVEVFVPFSVTSENGYNLEYVTAVKKGTKLELLSLELMLQED